MPPEHEPGLTAEELKAFLACLDPDPERAALLYLQIQERLVRLLQWRGCRTPEDVAQQVIDRVARKVAQGTEVRNPSGYSFTVARLVLLEVNRRRDAERRVIEELLTLSPDPPAEEEDRVGACLQQCLDGLPDQQSELVLSYHGEADHIRGRRALAKKLDISLNALRIRVHRLREELAECVRHCLEGQR